MNLNRRVLRTTAVTTALAGAMLMATSQPAQAYWIYGYSGAFSAQQPCEADREQRQREESEAGQMFATWPCAYHSAYPGPGGGGSPGWYYRWGIFAA